MRKILLAILILLPLSLNATTYYVATTGSDTYPGTLAQPFATWQKGMETAEAGDTVYIRGGVYYPTTVHSSQTIIVIAPHADTPIGHDGTASDPVCIFNYPDEVPILDCRLVSVPVSYLTGIGLTRVNYWKLKGLTVRYILQDKEATIAAISSAGGSNITFENIIVHNIGGKGFIYSSDFQEYPEQASFPGDTIRYINCDAHNCMDSLARVVGNTDYGNYSDGFWCSVGNEDSYIQYTGCRSWLNSDDGFDIPSNGVMEVTNCWSFNNGHLAAGVGQGIRLELVREEWIDRIDRYAMNNIAAFNSYAGFTEGYPGYPNAGINFYNNTSVGNKYGIIIAGDRTGDELDNIYRNNIFYDNTTFDALLSRDIRCPMNNHDHNTWTYTTTYGFSEWTTLPDIDPEITMSDADFLLTNEASILEELEAARQADFSLPEITAFHLAPTSDMVGVGVDVGMSATPDLGVDWAYLGSGVSVDSVATGIITFTFPEQIGIATIDTVTGTPSVDVEVEYGTDVTDLTPTITLDYGATISPLSGVSGDFTTPQTYTVTALNGITEKEYIITVTVATEPPAPEVATIGTVSADYTAVTANITGRIYSANGGTLTARGVCWSTTNTSPTITDNRTIYTASVGSFTDVLRGLRGNTTYYARAYATTAEGGTSYGDAISFTTPVSSQGKTSGKIGMTNGKIGILK